MKKHHESYDCGECGKEQDYPCYNCDECGEPVCGKCENRHGQMHYEAALEEAQDRVNEEFGIF